MVANCGKSLRLAAHWRAEHLSSYIARASILLRDFVYCSIAALPLGCNLGFALHHCSHSPLVAYGGSQLLALSGARSGVFGLAGNNPSRQSSSPSICRSSCHAPRSICVPMAPHWRVARNTTSSGTTNQSSRPLTRRLISGVEAVEKPPSERQNDPPRWRISRFIVVNGGVDFSVFADASIFAHDRAA